MLNWIRLWSVINIFLCITIVWPNDLAIILLFPAWLCIHLFFVGLFEENIDLVLRGGKKVEIGTPVVCYALPNKEQKIGEGIIIDTCIVGFKDEKTEMAFEIPEVPVIKLDDGRTIHGFDCWWHKKEETQ